MQEPNYMMGWIGLGLFVLVIGYIIYEGLKEDGPTPEELEVYKDEVIEQMKGRHERENKVRIGWYANEEYPNWPVSKDKPVTGIKCKECGICHEFDELTLTLDGECDICNTKLL